MKKIFLLLLTSISLSQMIRSQSFAAQGKPITEIFTDFHFNLRDTTKTTGFGLNRAYIGYKFLPENNFSATLIVNIGNPDELITGSTHRRYAYFREASFSWSKDKLSLSMGITDTKIFSFQQKFWGKRYIANTYQSINGYGYVADLGFAMDYKFNDKISVDFTLMNGEGYSEIQLDNSVKTSAGFTITPVKSIAIRLYGDIDRPHGVWQNTLIGFIGFKNDIMTIGGEISYKSNLDKVQGHNAWGVSGTGSVRISDKTEIFARYDHSSSSFSPSDNRQWNYLLDGSFAVFGVQYTFNENVRIALDYQSIYPYNPGVMISDAVFVNAHFKF